MKIFEDVFELNKYIAFMNRDRELDFSILSSSERLEKDSYTQTPVVKNQDFSSGETYIYTNTNVNQSLIDADYISKEFEKDSRRYPGNLEIESGGKY